MGERARQSDDAPPIVNCGISLPLPPLLQVRQVQQRYEAQLRELQEGMERQHSAGKASGAAPPPTAPASSLPMRLGTCCCTH